MALCTGGGDGAPLAARAAASACWRSFLRRLSSAPRLELSGRREEGGEWLGGRLLWEPPPPPLPPPATEDEWRLLLRGREEERRDEYCGGERLLERPGRRGMGLVLEDLRVP